MGSFFLGGRAGFGEGTSQQEEALLSLEPLSRVIARFPALASQSHFILLPGYSTLTLLLCIECFAKIITITYTTHIHTYTHTHIHTYTHTHYTHYTHYHTHTEARMWALVAFAAKCCPGLL